MAQSQEIENGFYSFNAVPKIIGITLIVPAAIWHILCTIFIELLAIFYHRQPQKRDHIFGKLGRFYARLEQLCCTLMTVTVVIN